MDLGGAEIVPIATRELFNDELIQYCLQILEVGHVTAGTEDGVVTDSL